MSKLKLSLGISLIELVLLRTRTLLNQDSYW